MAAGDEIPAGVRRLIGERIESVAQLEVLLLLRAAPDKAWSPDEVGRALVTRADAAAGFLRHLAMYELLTRSEDDQYRFAPPAGMSGDVDALAQCYATRRTTVIGLIFAPRPGDSAAASLAAAVRVRRP